MVYPVLKLFKYLLLTTGCLCCLMAGQAQGLRQGQRQGQSKSSRAESGIPAKIAFYNVESLCDTIDDPLLNDTDFTPSGRYGWDSQKYHAKLRNIASVLDRLDADVIGLAEVESESVVRELMFTMQDDYNYIHRDTKDFRGMDQVLLYKSSSFEPQRVRQQGGKGVSRAFLIVEGVLHGVQVTFIVCHMPSMMNSTTQRENAARALRGCVDAMLERDSSRCIVVMGDFNFTPTSYLGKTVLRLSDPKTLKNSTDSHPLYSPFVEAQRKGYGTYVYRNKRFVYDMIAFTSAVQKSSQMAFDGTYEIFARADMLRDESTTRGVPIRGTVAGDTTVGFSDHLPVSIQLRVTPAQP